MRFPVSLDTRYTTILG
ncbi:Protein of unknown function [Escherichia coli D6-113.11]|nr:Protein of unknown function [Escherichia coli D6-113.11]CDU36782.1 Protein of unknown function [Escherichia coli D6-113.11]